MEWLKYITFPLVVAIGLPQILGGLSGAATAKSIATWYKNDVRKPSWHPPLALFGMIWPVLYFLIGFASYVVYVEGAVRQACAGPLALYALQLLLNIAWQPLFFNVRNWRLAQVDNLGTLLLASLTGWSFYKIKPLAGWLFVPYVAFLVFANQLNFAVRKLNPEIEKGGSSNAAGRPTTPAFEASARSRYRSASQTPKPHITWRGVGLSFSDCVASKAPLHLHKPVRESPA
eukprot:jgi/Botrbrau1/18422/Bobra.0072s0014.1